MPRWLDETPVSRTITRMTQDIRSIDGVLMWYLEGLASQSIQMIIDLVSAVLFVPVFSIPGLLIASVGMYMGSKYLKAQLSVKRETRRVCRSLPRIASDALPVTPRRLWWPISERP